MEASKSLILLLSALMLLCGRAESSPPTQCSCPTPPPPQDETNKDLPELLNTITLQATPDHVYLGLPHTLSLVSSVPIGAKIYESHLRYSFITFAYSTYVKSLSLLKIIETKSKLPEKLLVLANLTTPASTNNCSTVVPDRSSLIVENNLGANVTGGFHGDQGVALIIYMWGSNPGASEEAVGTYRLLVNFGRCQCQYTTHDGHTVGPFKCQTYRDFTLSRELTVGMRSPHVG